MDLTIGPNQFFWPAETVGNFYREMTASPASRVVLGELVCSKRLPFWEAEIPGAIEALLAAGKEVALTTLALITLKRERRLTSDLMDIGLPIEVNDLTALHQLPAGTPFWVGPLVNVYNEGTLRWLAKRGATRVCLPPELPLESVSTLASAATELDVAIEVWGHGRLPLALSGRCYHARLHNRAKDSCQFVCEEDPDGRRIETLDDQPFLAVNGIQTLSASTATAAYQIGVLKDAGVSALRLSPQSSGFAEIVAMYHRRLVGEISGDTLVSELLEWVPGGALCDGFLTGPAGASWSRHPAPANDLA